MGYCYKHGNYLDLTSGGCPKCGSGTLLWGTSVAPPPSSDGLDFLAAQVAALAAENARLRERERIAYESRNAAQERCNTAERQTAALTAENARLRADLARVESESAREITRLGVELSEAKHVASGLTADLAHLTVDAAENPPVPDETPGVRDAEFPCEDYAPVTDAPMPWANCESDGHHLCKGCRWYAPRLDPGSDKYEEPTS